MDGEGKIRLKGTEGWGGWRTGWHGGDGERQLPRKRAGQKKYIKSWRGDWVYVIGSGMMGG